ncbi:MAG: response regulator transcription factor [Proteobacteria bacterium]|nr:MAG: response regulator transcription factor [Pseudomonadota bacterium]
MSEQQQTLSRLKDLSHIPYTVTLDDDPVMAKIIEETLSIKNFAFVTSEQLLECAEHLAPIGAFIDIHLKDECGLDIIPRLRSLWPMTAIIVISGDESDNSVTQALAAGADDFVRKPISPAEVVARLRARIEDLNDKNRLNLLKFGDLKVDLKYKSISGAKGQLILSAREIDLLSELIRAQGTIVPKDVLKRELWGSLAVSDNALDRKIFEVRKALREVSDNVELHSIYGIGMVLRLRNQEAEQTLLNDFDESLRSGRKVVRSDSV